MDCIFCKLANGEIPTATLYEDDEFRVILDQGPATKGHTAYTIVESDGKLPEEIADTIRQNEHVLDVMVVQM